MYSSLHFQLTTQSCQCVNHRFWVLYPKQHAPRILGWHNAGGSFIGNAKWEGIAHIYQYNKDCDTLNVNLNLFSFFNHLQSQDLQWSNKWNDWEW